MEILPADRRRQIVALLQEEGIVLIRNLSERFDVSHMTIHRDLDLLEERGHLRKVRGGAVPVTPPVTTPGPDAHNTCEMCGKPAQAQTRVLLNREDGGQMVACCPHCGLMLLSRRGPEIASMLVTDFLYGAVGSAQTAFYVVDPDVTVCCSPSTLSFSRREDATRFQKGFGGEVLPFTEAVDFIHRAMQVSSPGGEKD
jgi:hypothetical protein